MPAAGRPAPQWSGAGKAHHLRRKAEFVARGEDPLTESALHRTLQPDILLSSMRHLICFLSSLLLAASAAAAEPGWQPLFNGRDLSGWDTFVGKPDKSWDVPGLKRDDNGNYPEAIGINRDPLKVFTVETVDGQPAVHISGQGFGTMTTTNSFANFHLRLQFKWGEKRWGRRANTVRDSGLLYFGSGDLGAVDGSWPRSIEFQIQEHDCGDLYTVGTRISVRAMKPTNLWIYDPKGEPTVFASRRPAPGRCVKLANAEKPRGEWNTLELVCLGGDSIHIVNGTVVMRLSEARTLDGAPLTSGNISLQTEGAEVFYRQVEIQPITEVPKEFKPEN